MIENNDQRFSNSMPGRAIYWGINMLLQTDIINAPKHGAKTNCQTSAVISIRLETATEQ